MSRVRLRARRAALLALAATALTAVPARAEVVQRGTLRVSLRGKLSPSELPRRGRVPIRVALGGRIFTTDGSDPPALRDLEIAINRNAQLRPGALPTCRREQIQPAPTSYARRVCAAARVGEGSFSAAVAIPEQSPFPSRGTVTAFNGLEAGRPVIFLHVYGTQPVPTSFTLPLEVGRGQGSFGTVLRGSLPAVDTHVGFVTGISLHLDGRGASGERYLTAGCPAPPGFRRAVFPLARLSFGFEAGPTLAETLLRSCAARD